MAEMQKVYRHSAVMLLNVANDIVEMYKAKVTVDDGEQFGFDTEMYGKNTSYYFRMSEIPDGCLLSIVTPEEGDKAEQHLFFMLSIVDSMLTTVTTFYDTG